MFGLPAAFNNLPAGFGTGLPNAFSNAAMGAGTASIQGLQAMYAAALQGGCQGGCSGSGAINELQGGCFGGAVVPGIQSGFGCGAVTAAASGAGALMPTSLDQVEFATPAELEFFIATNPVEEKAIQSLRCMDPRAQKVIINRGSLSGARNATAALIGRMSQIHKQFPDMCKKRELDDDGLEMQPKKRRSKPQCWFWDNGCCEKDNCPFAHDGQTGNAGVIDITEPCWYFVRGLCTKGEKCIFPHTTPEQDFANLLMQRIPVIQQTQAAALMVDPSSGMILAQWGEDQVQIPSRTARTLIGVAGNNTKLFTQVTGCAIQIDKDVVNGMQNAKISGMLAHLQVAKTFIEQQAEVDLYTAKASSAQTTLDPTDDLTTSIKVALQAANVQQLEEPPEVPKIMSKIVNFATSAAEEVDTSGLQPLDGIVPLIFRSFFEGVCSTYADRPWLTNMDFQLVLEATLKKHLPETLLTTVTKEQLSDLIWTNHDLVFEEQRFLPAMWDLVRAVVDGPKMKKKAYKAFEVGRLNAVVGAGKEGTGLELANAEIFLQRWVSGCLDNLAEEGLGDPENVLSKEQVLGVFNALLAVPDARGACSALPARWSAEVGVPPQGFSGILDAAYDNKLVAFKAAQPPPVFAPAAAFLAFNPIPGLPQISLPQIRLPW